MPENKIIKFPHKEAAGATEDNGFSSNVSNIVYTYSKYPHLRSFCFSRFYSIYNKLDLSVENMRDLVFGAMRSQEMKTIDAKLTYVLIRNRFDPTDMLEHNTKILGYMIEGKDCDIYYNKSTRDIEIRIPKNIDRINEDRFEYIATKISQAIDRSVRNEISRIDFLELLRGKKQD
jgi:hypothetical protein